MTTELTPRGSSKVLLIVIILVVILGIGIVISFYKPKPTSSLLNQPPISAESKVKDTLPTNSQINQPSISSVSKVSPTTSNLTEKWAGPWTNSLGEKGDDTLDITEDGAGNFQGLWSGNIKVTGQWLDKTSMKMSGRTSTRDYQVQGTIQGNTLILKYVATRLNTSGTYTGEEKLTRVSP